MDKKPVFFFALILTVLISGCVDLDCFSDDDCPKNYRCYNSQPCTMTDSGADCAPQQGDLKCHKLCSTRLECTYLAECREFTIFTENITENLKLCS